MSGRKGRNFVIKGDYLLKLLGGAPSFMWIRYKMFKSIQVNSKTVESIEFIDEDPINDFYVAKVVFKDGKKSLIEMDGDYYTILKRIKGYDVEL